VTRGPHSVYHLTHTCTKGQDPMSDDQERVDTDFCESGAEVDEPSTTPWRSLWALADGQPAWLRDSVATMDAAAQAEMGHT
jgi:hypothetical protein